MAAKTRARVARRWKSIGFLVLALALGGGLMSLVPGVAGADTSSGKSASFAQAHSSHAAVRGGSGHGKAIGRSRVQRTQYPPLATPEQQRNQQAAEQIEAVGPVGATRDTGGNARPTSLPMGAAAKKAAARSVTQGVRPNASTDLEFYRAHGPVPSGVTGADDTDEPSTANDGNVVLYTGNWYAAESTDSGNTFTYINPYSLGPSPTKPNGGFCCDQVVVHAPYNGVTVWGLLYCPTTCGSSPSGDNIIRLAVARNHANLESSTFDYYDFSAQDFGFPANDWLDYPHFGVNNGSLVMTLNVFNGGTFINSMVARFSLASFASGGWSANWANMSTPQDFTWTPVDGSTDTWAYWGATIYNDGTKFRVYNWPPGTDYTHVGFNDFTVSYNYEWKNGTCSAPDGLNSCAFDDSRVKTGGEVGSSSVTFMWDAKQGGGFAYPYTEIASFDVSSGPASSKTGESQIWNSSYSWSYPGVGVDARGHMAMTDTVAGGGWGYPSSQLFVNDDISGGWAAYYLDGSAHSTNRWGDYTTVRPATTGSSMGNTWIVGTFAIHDNGFGSPNTIPSFYWVGRQRDDPFAPSFWYHYSNSYTEGAPAFQYTAIFTTPSNCTCDYYAYNYYGDGTNELAGLYNYAEGNIALSGTHTYAEEGSYTTTLYAYDNWGNSSSTNGSSTVADAALTATGKSVTAAAGVSLANAVVATFKDADPAGTASDYTASINWGDGATTSGSISGSGTFKVKGTHTYTTTGTKTITVTVHDVGGASAVGTGNAKVGSSPAVTSLSPTSGTHSGGTTVTINGSGFTGTKYVKFGNAKATSVTVVSDTKITCKSPAHATGLVDVRVTTKYATSPVVTGDRYTFT